MDHLDLVMQKGYQTGDWSDITMLDNAGEALYALNLLHEKIPGDQLYGITLDVYTYSRIPFPKRRILDLRKIRPSDYLKDFPEKLADIDPVVIYRATLNGDAKEVRKEISWTTNKDTALFFYGRNLHIGFKEVHLYQGTIEKSKIIAYTNQRNEFEVLQHMGVRNIEEVTVSMPEVKSIMDKHAHEIKKQWEEITCNYQMQHGNQKAGE